MEANDFPEIEAITKADLRYQSNVSMINVCRLVTHQQPKVDDTAGIVPNDVRQFAHD
jgi:hypothetical protein